MEDEGIYNGLKRKDLIITAIIKAIIKVLKFAKSKGIKSIAFLGNDGGKCKSYSDLSLIIKSKINVTKKLL